MNLEDFVKHLQDARKNEVGYRAKCPSCRFGRPNNKKRSLSMKESADGKILLCCLRGCSAAQIVDSIGLRLSDLFSR